MGAGWREGALHCPSFPTRWFSGFSTVRCFGYNYYCASLQSKTPPTPRPYQRLVIPAPTGFTWYALGPHVSYIVAADRKMMIGEIQRPGDYKGARWPYGHMPVSSFATRGPWAFDDGNHAFRHPGRSHTGVYFDGHAETLTLGGRLNLVELYDPEVQP